MGTVTILDTTSRKPITLIGERAGICCGANTSDPAKNYKRGWDCITSGHGRALEFVNVEMVLDGYSARVIREWYTHIGGAPTRLQASTRYIDYGEFDYVVPASVKETTQREAHYRNAMTNIMKTVEFLERIGVPREDAAMLLPLGMTTRIVDKRNLRNLIDMSRQRMCNRTLWEFRELFRDISCALVNYSEEWGWIVNNCFHEKCVELGYCPEKHGCGKYPKAGE
jgi:thymidylate synthase (FAD)